MNRLEAATWAAGAFLALTFAVIALAFVAEWWSRRRLEPPGEPHGDVPFSRHIHRS